MPYREKGKTTWRAKVKFRGRAYTKTCKTKREALVWEADTRKKCANRTRTGMDLLTLCNVYLDYAVTHFTPNTAGEKRTLCRRIIKAWGQDTPAMTVSPAMVLDYLERQGRERSANAYNRDRKNLMALFAHGVKYERLPANPVTRVPTIHHERGPQYTPPVEDVLKVMAVATRPEQVMLDCYLNTAARRSEIFRWTWADDINFEQRQVRLGTRKTRDGSMSYEWVPMSAALYTSLKWHYKHREVKATAYVFVSIHPGPHYGQPFTHRRGFILGLCERAKVRPFGYHALRRFVASYLADVEKVSAKTIQRILRHKNVTTTERYIHNINHDLAQIYDTLGDFKTKGHMRGHVPLSQQGEK